MQKIKYYLTNKKFYVKIMMFYNFLNMKKYIPISILALTSVFSLNIANANSLFPSLQAQMQRQNVINEIYAKDKIRMNNSQRLEEIRQLNVERLNNWNFSSNSQNQNSTTTTVEIKIPEVNPILKEQALSRVVTRNNSANNIVLNSAPINNNIVIENYSNRQKNNVDLARIEQTWLNWVNSLRAENNLHSYNIDSRLSTTAQEWSEFSANRGYIIHGRPGDGCVGEKNYSCYNFNSIDNWFKDRWIDPKIISRSKHTENLGIWSFSCSSSDCTDTAIKAIKKTYNFFLSEKSYNWVHYRTMISKNFTKMWLGLDFKNWQYYLTIHYSNDF